jgi:uncharacterized RDD family membrane protein YckC
VPPWVAQVFLPVLALLVSIPSAVMAVRDLRTKSRGQDALRAKGVGTATVWVPPTNTERPPAPPPPPPPPSAGIDPHRPGPADRKDGRLAETPTGAAWVAPLGLWRRTIAYLINVVVIPTMLLTIPGSIGSAVDPLPEQSDLDYSDGASVGYWVGTALIGIYAIWNIYRAAVSGRSIGLKIVGGAALDEDTGLPVGVGRVLQRTWWVLLTFCFVGLVVPLSALGRPDRRTWADRGANTVVVRFDPRESARRARPVVAQPRSVPM